MMNNSPFSTMNLTKGLGLTAAQPKPQMPPMNSLLGNPALLAGLGLLGASRDSSINPYQAALGGVMGAEQFTQNQSMMDIQRQKMEVQQQEAEAKKAEAQRQAAAMQKYQELADSGQTPDAVLAYQAGIPVDAWKAQYKQETSDSPANIREWEIYSKLPPEQQKQYLAMKRAQQVKDFGGYFGNVNVDGSVDPIGAKTLPPEKDPNYLRNAESQKAIGKGQGEVAATAETDIAKGQQFMGLIDKAISHPGRESATGKSSVFNSMALPGGDRKDYLVLADQLRGQNFMEAYQGLKGGGQITEVEGLKAENAQARLNEAQSEEEYLAALKEMKLLVAERIDRINAMVNGSTAGGNDGWGIIE